MINTNLNSKVNILLYHQIGESPNIYTNLDCFCSKKEFHLQMKFLENSDYKVISLSDAVDLIFNKKKLDSKYVVLTFDDGCEKFYDITFPILDSFNFSSSIYPVVGYIGKHANWSIKNNPELKILSKKKLKELHELGVEIGSHTMDHFKLTQVKKSHAINQVKESKEKLEQLLGKNISSFSYPHGDFNQETIEILKDNGFSNALTCISNYAEQAKSVFEIPRKYITYFDTLEMFKQKLT